MYTSSNYMDKYIDFLSLRLQGTYQEQPVLEETKMTEWTHYSQLL